MAAGIAMTWVGALAAALLVWVLARVLLGRAMAAKDARLELFESAQAGPGSERMLVVLVHGMAGRRSFEGALSLVRKWLPAADIAVAEYGGSFASNVDAYAVADLIEREVHRLVSTRGYGQLVLVGHSAGGAVLRKALVWAHGEEDDRERLGVQGRRAWADRVVRVVLLAGINRGFTVDPRPRNMGLGMYLQIRFGLLIGRVFGIARFARQLYRGEPFVADTRVQWLRVARSDAVVQGLRPWPTVIQLVGSRDDIVAREDSLDLIASHGSLFKTVPQTGHREIGASLDDSHLPGHALRLQAIRCAVVGDIAGLEPDRATLPPENREVSRIVYILHGIRDYGDWTDTVREAVEARLRAGHIGVEVVNPKYGYFPMLPFITYRDRLRNVRRFMDEYTENLARFPNARTIDFVGHSNGTYILACALSHYATPQVRRVFFAGSVVPKHYPWRALIAGGRVTQVVNVVATSDWVVALFPKLFEQIADWLGQRPTQGWLDIGAAGFRGFLDSGDASGAVINLKFTAGQHSAGVDVGIEPRLRAIVDYVVDGDVDGLERFRDARVQNPLLDVASNVSYLVWLGLLLVAIAIGWAAAELWGGLGLVAYGVLLFLLLHSV